MPTGNRDSGRLDREDRLPAVATPFAVDATSENAAGISRLAYAPRKRRANVRASRPSITSRAPAMIAAPQA